MLYFILKPEGKLEYQDNALLLKFKGNPSIDTCRKSRWKFLREKRIWPARKSFRQPHAPVSENDVNVCKQISSLYINKAVADLGKESGVGGGGSPYFG